MQKGWVGLPRSKDHHRWQSPEAGWHGACSGLSAQPKCCARIEPAVSGWRRSAGRILLTLTLVPSGCPKRKKPGRVCWFLLPGIAPVEPLALDRCQEQHLDSSSYSWRYLPQWSSGVLLTELLSGFPLAWTLCSPKHNKSSSLFYSVLYLVYIELQTTW